VLRHVAAAKEPEARGLAVEILVASQGEHAYARTGSALAIAAQFYQVDLKKIHAAALKKAREAAAQEARGATSTGRKGRRGGELRGGVAPARAGAK
jgi:hypothetical protein